jgi:hypothetical protein
MIEYFHHTGKMQGGILIQRDQIIPFNGRQLLVVQCYDGETPYSRVGFTDRARYSSLLGIPVSSNPISLNETNGFYRPDLEQAVRKEGFKGVILTFASEKDLEHS